MQETPLFIFGEVLFDQFPDGSVVLGGAPFNVAWHLQALGHSPLLISRVGNDGLGVQIRSKMRDWGMDLNALQSDSQHPTGTVSIAFKDGEPCFDILDHQAYDFIETEQLPAVSHETVIYHGSLALRNAVSRASLDRLLEGASASIFMDVNLRAPWWENEQVISRLKAARWAKLNDAELRQLSSSGRDLNSRAQALQETCDLDLLIVTRGAQGAMVRTREGRVQEVVPERFVAVVDTVGAGDAFSAIVLLGLVQGWELGTTLERAQSFASTIVGIRGASPHNSDLYARFNSEWSQT
ncbi:MAG: carbohydrate kinase [Gammaproteobacteria bacterium]|nr:carbohydrate kinase [Gammaproteobacteria bacterium]